VSVIVPGSVLVDAGRQFERAGADGAEATALLVAGPDRIVRRVLFPDQRAGRYPSCWVQVTEQGKSELAAALGLDEKYVSRIHSHPGDAFHSPTDDRNPALRFDGAISIVVPFFGLGARLGLDACAVYVRRDRRWHELPPGCDRDEVIRVDP
jgi:hypothetical protein